MANLEDDLTPEQRTVLIAQAHREYGDGSDHNIEVDNDAEFSVGNDGTWVQAWVFLDGV